MSAETIRDRRAAAIARLHESNRSEGDWKTWAIDDRTVVGWLPWRSDCKPETVIEVANARDGRVMATMLNAFDARLPKGHEFSSQGEV